MERARGGLRKIMAEALRQSAPAEGPMLAWPLVCGAAVAARTRALRFSSGVLTVEAQDDTWRRQLVGFSNAYLAAVNEIVSERVEKIEFVLADPRRSH